MIVDPKLVQGRGHPVRMVSVEADGEFVERPLGVAHRCSCGFLAVVVERGVAGLEGQSQMGPFGRGRAEELPAGIQAEISPEFRRLRRTECLHCWGYGW